MSAVYHLRVWTRHLEPPERVWTHKTDPERLAAEFRPMLAMKMSDADREKMSVLLGSVENSQPVEVQLCVAGLTWPMRLELLESGRAYRDISRNRLVRNWAHEHRVIPSSDGCLYVDEVEFEPALPGHLRWARMTERLLQHRHRVASESLRSEAFSIGIGALRKLR